MVRSVAVVVLGALVAALLGVPGAEAQTEPILRLEGRVVHVSPREMLVELTGGGGVVMIDLARIPQSEIQPLSQNDYVVVVGFIRRPSHRVIATSIQRVSPWVPTTPRWAPQTP